MDGIEERAEQLMSLVMKTWDPPRFLGSERPGDIAQSATMITIAYIMGRDFMPPNMTENQAAAIDSGLKVLNSVVGSEERKPTLAEWMEGWEAAVESGQSRISRAEAERRYYIAHGGD